MQTTAGEGFDEIRGAIRALCAEFPAEYHRKIDEQRGYPEAFVEALTKAGWMAALIPGDYGGFGFACEYDVERKFRETRLYQIAPISTNLILSYVAEHVLGLPRSF
jgi:alkylation response protein AidB-like acyl-CoA dehydrogenase